MQMDHANENLRVFTGLDHPLSEMSFLAIPSFAVLPSSMIIFRAERNGTAQCCADV